MKKFLHHIRKQPEEVRKSILHFLTVAIAVILLALWVYSLGSNLSSAYTQAQMKQGLNPFSVLKDNFSSLW